MTLLGVMYNQTTALRDLQKAPGIGPSLARDLLDLGFQSLEELRDQNPENMYQSICTRRGMHIDPCVLYAFRCAVYFASNQTHDPELLKWWNWKTIPPA
jgi:Pathogenicity locus